MSHAADDEWLEALIGRTLRAVEEHDHTWVFAFDAEVVICTYADWRLMVDGRIRVSSHDHGHVFGLPRPVDAVLESNRSVAGRIVESATIGSDTGDLRLEFGRSVRIELLQLSTGYESWDLSTPRGRTICTGGGCLVHLPRE